MKKFLQEFKVFALKGNVMNLAVGVIIGAAFQGVVTSLTDNILSPLIGLFTRQNFDDKALDFLGVTLRYGAFLTSVINFVIMAFVVFLMVRAMNRLMPDKKPAPEAPKPKCPYCLTEIQTGATRCPACTSHLEQVVPS
ncbi:MAG: large conductance mechanosensitive channel protein MscL [Oscillospiraceae bacterium]